MGSVSPLHDGIRSGRIVDLSHSFGPKTPLYEGFPATQFRAIPELRDFGVFSQYFGFTGQCATHLDPPGHLVPDARLLDEIPAEDLVLPLALIDVHRKVERDADHCVGLSDLHGWESQHGRLPERCFVAVRTDWGRRWPDDEAMQNRDEHGVSHWPGWDVELLRFLAEERGVVAIGHETIGTDGGVRTSRGEFTGQRLWHAYDRYQIEMMCNLNLVPAVGGIIFCGAPKPIRGSGFPARVLAVLPH